MGPPAPNSWAFFRIMTGFRPMRPAQRPSAMQMSHILPHRSIDLCDAPRYMNFRQSEETLEQFFIAAKRGGPGENQMEPIMGLNFFRRYFHARNVYWNVVRELS